MTLPLLCSKCVQAGGGGGGGTGRCNVFLFFFNFSCTVRSGHRDQGWGHSGAGNLFGHKLGHCTHGPVSTRPNTVVRSSTNISWSCRLKNTTFHLHALVESFIDTTIPDICPQGLRVTHGGYPGDAQPSRRESCSDLLRVYFVAWTIKHLNLQTTRL